MFTFTPAHPAGVTSRSVAAWSRRWLTACQRFVFVAGRCRRLSCTRRPDSFAKKVHPRSRRHSIVSLKIASFERSAGRELDNAMSKSTPHRLFGLGGLNCCEQKRRLTEHEGPSTHFIGMKSSCG